MGWLKSLTESWREKREISRQAKRLSREAVEVRRSNELVRLTPVEQQRRAELLAHAQSEGQMVALAGTENRINQMVAEQTRGFRKEISDLQGHIATLSERIMYLENPNRPKAGEVGSGVGVFPRSSRSRKSQKSEIAGRPGTLKDAIAEGVAGEMARKVVPSEHPMRRDDAVGPLMALEHAGADPYNRAEAESATNDLHNEFVDKVSRTYPHGEKPESDLDAVRRMASAGEPLIHVDRGNGHSRHRGDE